YLSDMSAYEEYINPIGEKRNAFLSLKYRPGDLTVVGDELNGRGVSLSPYAAKALEAMLKEMRAQEIDLTNPQSGLKLTVISGYDENDASDDDRETGLSVILHNCSLADVSFENTKAGIWLKENCRKFGFILRYPQGKSAQTGETYSPWYFRYVGRYHAERMTEEDLCLEEYLSKYNYK
ncbi:MAG: M15 family metallopeptidase, partial [Firmicutes bacterium]|nr:M15 family metallopeptidase [Candidatus Colimorpha enterica]